MSTSKTHSVALGYVFLIFGFAGLHRFYFGKPKTGILWAFTFGLLGVGWFIDLFLIEKMARQTEGRFRSGAYDYTVGWLLLIFLGFLGVHRFYLGKIITGLLYLFTAGFFGFGVLYDCCNFNDRISEKNAG